jgi:hypothetical protein
MTISWNNATVGTTLIPSKITIGPSDAPDTIILASQNVTTTSGSLPFTAPADDGTYTAWLWQGGSSQTEVTSVTFTVNNGPTPTVSADKTTYAPGGAIVGTFSGLDMGPYDLIAVAPVGAPYYGFASHGYTGQRASGTVSLTAPAGNGTFVLRALRGDNWAIMAQSTATFTVTTAAAPAISTSSTYVAGAALTATFSGLDGDAYNRIVIAPFGSAANAAEASVNAGGSSGTASFKVPPSSGTYVARAIEDATGAIIKESTSFTVTGGTSPSLSHTIAGSTITATYGGLNGDWNSIALAVQGSPSTNAISPQITSKTSGTATFATPTSNGTYVVRTLSPSYALIFEDPTPITVTTGATPHLSANASYNAGATITATYSGFDGDYTNSIGLQVQATSNAYQEVSHLTGASAGGTVTFKAPAANGNYLLVALHGESRAFMASSAFTVTNGTTPLVSTDASGYLAGGAMTISFSGLDGVGSNYIALEDATTGAGFGYAKIGTQTSGSVTTLVAPSTTGNYIAYVLSGGLSGWKRSSKSAAKRSRSARSFHDDTGTPGDA